MEEAKQEKKGEKPTRRTAAQKLAAAQNEVQRYKKEMAEQDRKADARKKIILGGLVIVAGADTLSEAEIVGCLIGYLGMRADENLASKVRDEGVKALTASASKAEARRRKAGWNRGAASPGEAGTGEAINQPSVDTDPDSVSS